MAVEQIGRSCVACPGEGEIDLPPASINSQKVFAHLESFRFGVEL